MLLIWWQPTYILYSCHLSGWHLFWIAICFVIYMMLCLCCVGFTISWETSPMPPFWVWIRAQHNLIRHYGNTDKLYLKNVLYMLCQPIITTELHNWLTASDPLMNSFKEFLFLYLNFWLDYIKNKMFCCFGLCFYIVIQVWYLASSCFDWWYVFQYTVTSFLKLILIL